ncbi:XRE family transcriptional regulator [Pontibacter roseus]|uniref:XRE family transcriptional regulator n=1 Tax=Pontibacter roseus TaxID=336989 RepID=UPI00036C73C4|nr:XRE family transcriptional regulator [Pontibacter roseus]
MEIEERITRIKEHFRLSNAQLAELTGVSSISVSNIEKGITDSPKLSFLQRLSEKLGIRIEWRLLGKGEMLDEPSGLHEPGQRIAKQQEASLYVTRPATTQQSASGYLKDRESSGPYGHMAFIPLPGMEADLGSYTVFQVKADSMAPLFLDGEYVICSRLEQGQWPGIVAHVPTSHDYLIW